MLKFGFVTAENELSEVELLTIVGDFDGLVMNTVSANIPEFCLTFGGITTGIQILRHVIMFRITNGLPLGTSNTDTWRLTPSTRCQLLVDRSELCTNVTFKFSQLILKAKKTVSCTVSCTTVCTPDR